MEKIVNVIFYTVLAVIVFFVVEGLVNNADAADYSNAAELYMANEAGGVVALTKEPCAFPEAVKKGFDSRAYATEGNTRKHEGCWFAPSTAEAPKSEEVRIIPVVNTWWDGEVITFMQNQFAPDNKPAEVKGTL